MRSTLTRLFLVVLLSCGAPPALGYTMGPATLISGLVWGFSTAVPGLSGCNELHLDAIGDPARSSMFGVHGLLECPDIGSSYAASGTAVIGKDGSLGLSVRVGVNGLMVCSSLRGFSGTCQLFSLSAQPFGPAQLTFR